MLNTIKNTMILKHMGHPSLA